VKEFPKIISVGRHVVEPAHLVDLRAAVEVPRRRAARERRRVGEITFIGDKFSIFLTAVPARPARSTSRGRRWFYEDLVRPYRLDAAFGYPSEDHVKGVKFDEHAPGLGKVKAPLEDMETTG